MSGTCWNHQGIRSRSFLTLLNPHKRFGIWRQDAAQIYCWKIVIILSSFDIMFITISLTDSLMMHDGTRVCLDAWWSKDAFGQQVEESKMHGQNGLLALYHDYYTFWFPCSSTVSLLKDRNISPQQIYSYDSMFLWDPMVLVDGGIPCPNLNEGCRTPLWWHYGHAPHPRRVVDLNRTFWIIGYRYCCPNCKSPLSVTFCSCILDSSLSTEFPTWLSYHSDKCLGIHAFLFPKWHGCETISNTLLVQHLQSYDQLHLSTSRPLSGQK